MTVTRALIFLLVVTIASAQNGHRAHLRAHNNGATESAFMRAATEEDVDFWGRELGKRGSHSKGKGSKSKVKGGSKSKGKGGSKSKSKESKPKHGSKSKGKSKDKSYSR
eukprot:CAMPEP_0183294000 /NCGR_PEP_ID=MMETSP0160_2-20130417/2492_1 /TAXON_ID=2839 ORGANISM="Odontella Sinensis, Strain Grunow 1884" /NCGR_SAMPLE_ID=MMETSP0160_2 /ASSEMBLY_ACC=CAM_ASM_000250 /LENGTH=108 /DNA_ID=CAMNT_0025455225 /DNA_START=87 /DNA_END=413 /DNA_ORIENTATION=+